MEHKDLQKNSLKFQPGEDLILEGISDLKVGKISVGSCLVSIASPKLKQFGMLPKNFSLTIPDPELTLYRLLRKEKGNAYGRYNFLLRELVSFERALTFACLSFEKQQNSICS